MPITISRRRVLSAGVALAGLTRLHPIGSRARSTRLNVAVSTPLLADIVSRIAGEQADVFPVMPAGADPHTWEASPEDIVRVTSADTFISVGTNLEPFIEAGGWRRAVRDGGIPELAVTEGIELIVVDKVIDHGDHVHDLREGDPHFWLDPRKVLESIPLIERHLASLDPEGTDRYAIAAAAFAEEIAELDGEIAADLATIPADRRRLIVFHDAYTYFAARYDFEVAGIVLKNPDTEVSARELVNLQSTIDKLGINVVFAEPQFNTNVLNVLVENNEVEIGELLTDSLADRADSYAGLMRFNRDSLLWHLADKSHQSWTIGSFRRGRQRAFRRRT